MLKSYAKKLLSYGIPSCTGIQCRQISHRFTTEKGILTFSEECLALFRIAYMEELLAHSTNISHYSFSDRFINSGWFVIFIWGSGDCDITL